MKLSIPYDILNPVNVMSGDPVFQLLLSIHNTIQRVQCFQCPPPALCTDARDLVQEVNTSVYSVHVYTVQS